jgi:hypothetical protein
MKVNKGYKEAILFNLKMMQAIKDNDRGILDEAKKAGQAIKNNDIDMIKRSIIQTVKRGNDILEGNNLGLFYEVIDAIDIPELYLVRDKMMLKSVDTQTQLKEVILNIISNDYQDEVLEEEVFLLYAYMAQKAAILDDREILDKVIKLIEALEEE